MNIAKQLIIVLLTFLAIACSPLKKLDTTKSSAEAAYQNQNYQEALTQYQQLVSMYQAAEIPVTGDVYLKLAKSAFELTQYDIAGDFYSKALDKGETLEAMSGLQNICVAQSDIACLTKFIENYQSVLKKHGILEGAQVQLFDMYVKNEKFEEAYSISEYFKVEITTPRLSDCIMVLEKLDKEKEAVKLCQKVLDQDENNEVALSWLAMYDYHRAEKWYKAEMATYNKNKNATTYAYLRRDLKKISAIFRVAKKRFEKLHQIDSENRQYIKYLKNCYLRLDMQKEAASMEQLLKN